MPFPRAFISFDFDHNESDKHLFAGQAKHSKTLFNIEDWSSKTSLPQSEWEKLIRDKINKCNLMIVLVGRQMSSAGGIGKEITFAKKHNVPVFGVYVDGAGTTSTLPTDLPRNRVTTWNWDNIAAAIDQVMGEGKNKP
jgi:hypothetical protein